VKSSRRLRCSKDPGTIVAYGNLESLREKHEKEYTMERQPYESPAGATQREQIKQEGANALDTAAERAKQAGDKAADIAQSAVDKVKQTADDLRSKDAGQIVGDARAKAAEVGDAAASRVDSAMTATGEQMSTLAQTVREKAPEGQAGEVASKAADALDRGGECL